LAAALLPAFGWLWSASSISPVQGDVREEINKTVALAPGSQVIIRGINGSVNIETWNSNQAEIHIEITASSREELERRPLLVENTPNSLTIRTEERWREEGGREGRVRHRVRLKLPASINLKASSINGGLEVGAISGSVAVSSVNGGVRIVQAGSATELTSINGRVSIALTELGSEGLRVSSINGGLELGFAETINAEIEVRSVNGGLNTDFPVAVRGEQRRGELSGTIGAGGPRIEIRSVNGGIRLKKL
jgi:DUF4097 and DUF4098 domain-containing protein YvlB